MSDDKSKFAWEPTDIQLEKESNDAAKGTDQDSNNPQAKSAEGDGTKEMQLIIDRTKALESITDPIQREAVRCEILIAQDKLSSL